MTITFWQAVKELAEMRDRIPVERRSLARARSTPPPRSAPPEEADASPGVDQSLPSNDVLV